MTISRRKFNRLAIIGGASFASSSGIFFPKPAEAYSLEFPLGQLSRGNVFYSFRQYSAANALPGVLTRILQGQSNVGGAIVTGAALQIRTSDQVLLQNQFVQDRTELANAGSGAGSSLLWGRQRQENFGPNVGFGFVQKYEDEFSSAKISGPTITGIYNSQKILAAQKLTPHQVAGSLLPIRSTFDDLGDWTGENRSGTSFTQYRTALGTVTSRYDLKKPGRGGFGIIQIVMEAEDQPNRDVIIKVKFI
jgi:hypothetical protein